MKLDARGKKDFEKKPQSKSYKTSPSYHLGSDKRTKADGWKGALNSNNIKKERRKDGSDQAKQIRFLRRST